MTNEQLAVLLSNYCDSLGSILEDIKNSLPDECIVEKHNFFGLPYQSYPILDDLNYFHGKLCDDVKALKVGCSKVGDV